MTITIVVIIVERITNKNYSTNNSYNHNSNNNNNDSSNSSYDIYSNNHDDSVIRVMNTTFTIVIETPAKPSNHLPPKEAAAMLPRTKVVMLRAPWHSFIYIYVCMYLSIYYSYTK